ncbi:hypothetical protein FRC07_009460 [Ceratobasidium sp. 392]|nr:hypothetical protein FRC07_009460 [Ceratobasidium sp. 392]
MILDVEQNPKSPRSIAVSSPSSPTQASFFQHPQSPVSYSTFPSTSSQIYNRNPNAPVSEVTSLLGHSYGRLDDDEQPPAYDDIRSESNRLKSRSRFWSYFALVVFISLLVYPIWISYDFYKAGRQTPDTPRYPPSEPSLPFPPSPLPSQPPPPPLDRSPGSPNEPYVLPVTGRTDLCRPWAYSINAVSRPSILDHRSTDRVSYTVPSLAPIHIETEAICLDSKGHSERCKNYERTKEKDVIAGQLQVLGGNVELPKIDISLQHGSEPGLEDVAICLMRRPREVKDGLAKSEDYKWVLGVYIWKSVDQPSNDSVFAGISITIVLPRSHTHDLSTQLHYFTQNIGSTDDNDVPSLSFGILDVTGNYGHIKIQNVAAAVVKGVSLDSDVGVEPARITQSIDLRSTYGIVGCNVTLVHIPSKDPVSVNLESEVGAVSGVFELDYPISPDTRPRFDISAYSMYSRTVLWVADPLGTKALRSNLIPTVLPSISMNLTSWYASAQALVPATYHGSLDLSSRYAAIFTNDRASRLQGRTVRWFGRGGSTSRGEVKWDGRGNEGGKVHMAAQYAAVKLLFLGLHDDDIKEWPKEGDETDPRWREFGEDNRAQAAESGQGDETGNRAMVVAKLPSRRFS